VPVYRGDNGCRVVEDGEKRVRDRGKEAVVVVGSPIDERAQVDPRREIRARARENDRRLDATDGGDRIVDNPRSNAFTGGWSIRTVVTPSASSTCIFG
jgi:hypothetical protein